MVEVFKTNVTDAHHSIFIIEKIHHNYPSLTANFDLEDCDNILRISTTQNSIDVECLQAFLIKYGCIAEVLEEEINVAIREKFILN